MKKLIPVIALAVFLVGCASQSRVAYNTLASIEATTVGAYGAYCNLVIQGKIPTNSVPQVSKDFNLFQASWMAAVMIAQWNTNTVAPPAVVELSTKVLTGVNIAKPTP